MKTIEVTIGPKKYTMTGVTIGVQLDTERWIRRQIIDAAIQGIEDLDLRARVHAQASALAMSVGYWSDAASAIRASFEGVAWSMFRMTQEKQPKLTWIEYEALIKKYPEDYQRAYNAWLDAFVYNRAEATTPGESDGASETAAT